MEIEFLQLQINGPNILTISGDTESLIQLANFYTKSGCQNCFVNAEAPYHSHYYGYLEARTY